MNHFKFTKPLLIFFLVLISSSPALAATRSMSIEMDLVENEVTVGKKIIVACTNVHVKRVVVKRNTQDQWCDSLLGSVCATNKITAARNVCSNSYRKKIAAQNNVDVEKKSNQNNIKDTDEVDKLKQELVEIELKRLDIADKILDLKRRELNMKKET